MSRRSKGEAPFPVVPALVVAFLGWQCRGAEPPYPHNSTGLFFADVTAEAGLGEFRHITGAVGNMWMPEIMGGGGAFIDYDGDGWMDIILVRGGAWTRESVAPALALYRNMGDGTFSDRTSEAGLGGVASYAFGATVADYDNDGDDDFYVTTLGENMLFRNDGGFFSEVGAVAGVAGPPEWSTAAVFFDADLDGLLDLYVGNYIKWSPELDRPCLLAGDTRSYCTPDAYEGLAGRFYHNVGDGSFSERTAEAGFGPPVPGKTLAAVHLDYNRDGHPDLIVANDTERDLLYENKGDGTFKEVGIISGIAFDRNGKARAGMGVDVGVVDSTGHPTVFISNFAREMVGAYQYTGRGRFVDRAEKMRIGQPSMNVLSFGIFVFDADLDGHLDLLTANGHIHPEVELVDGTVAYRQPVRLYRNLGDGTFSVADVGDEVSAVRMVGRGAAYGDFDRDGDLDVLLVENGGPAHLWRNKLRESATDTGGNGFLRVRLDGAPSNRSGIGARIEAVAGSRRMTQFVRTGSSYLSSSETTVTFGLGDAAVVDSLVVYWPAGGVTAYTQLKANQEITLAEGGGLVAVGLAAANRTEEK